MQYTFRLSFFFFIFCLFLGNTLASPGYNLWLDYHDISDSTLKSEYTTVAKSIGFNAESAMLKNAQKELELGLKGMLHFSPTFSESFDGSTTLLIKRMDKLNREMKESFKSDIQKMGKEGFIIKSIRHKENQVLLLTAETDLGILYGTFRLLHLMQTHQSLEKIYVVDAPKIKLRVLNHWDNLDRTVERGYAGISIFNWHKLPHYIDQRYIDYARANASIGINGTVLTNVNSNALVLTPAYLKKVKALADVFRPYGLKVYLTARFSAPMEIGELPTADPMNKEVQQWWKNKAKEIYSFIPDFGGFLVKANSEGQPGPQDYGRNQADGANMMAEALEPYNGVVIWRAFVYSENDASDRAKQAYAQFLPLDGTFKENVLVQVKNGAIDFQPREPFHPMFGAMPKTPLMMEFQITQEYLGFSTHLAYLPKLYEEVLQADTHHKGAGSTVAKVLDGSLNEHKLTGMAGVANIGNELNWTGYLFGQSNWYGFGRLAWNPYLSSEEIAEEWLRATFTNNVAFIHPVKDMMLQSRETVVNYMTPLGLHHIMNTGHHYGPGPWVSDLSRPEWNPTYYHKADTLGIGFNRTKTGSNATEQYAPEVAKIFEDLNTCPEEYLLWFHHLPWDYTLNNGHTLWDGLALKYQQGVNEVEEMVSTWNNAKEYVSEATYQDVKMQLEIQLQEAKWWRDACLSYFQTHSKQDLPAGVEAPPHTLDYYKSLEYPFAPGIRPQWD